MSKEEKELERVLGLAETSESADAQLLAAEVRKLRARLEALEPEVITFDEIVVGDLLRVSFPPRGGMSDNWSVTHSRLAIAYFLWDGQWFTTDHQALIGRIGHEDAVIERLPRLS